MKRTIFFLAFLVLFGSTCFGAEYAVDKGANMFSITAGFINASGDLYEVGEGNSSHTFILMPSVAHFSPRNFGLGSDLFFLHSGQGDEGLTTLGVGPKMMYFFGGKENKTYPYLTFGLYYISNSTSDGMSHYSGYGTRIKFGGGVSTMIAPHLGLMFEVSYNVDDLRGENYEESESGNMVIMSVGLAGFTF